MKTLRILLSCALLLFIFSSTARPALAGSSTAPLPSGNGKKVFIPLVTQKFQVSSYDLIDQAVSGGRISAEQGLIYKTYALFSDAALPAQYAGSVPEDGEAVMWQVSEQSGTLSAATRTALAPFFVPPSYPGSWYTRPRLDTLSDPPNSAGNAPQSTAADSWQFVAAAGGKIRVYYWSANASDQAKAASIAAAFDDRIWSKETTLMNKTPIPNAKTGATNIYLWTSYQRYSGVVVPFSDSTLGITVAPKCQGTEATIYLPDYLPVGSLISPGLIQYAAHEFMHVLQFSYSRPACSPYTWAMEATATWAEDFVYPLADSEHDSAQGYLTYPGRRLDDTDDMHDYGAYLLFYYLTHSLNPTGSVVRLLWENAAGTVNSYKALADAVDQAMPGERDYFWSGFLVSLWNKDPFHKYYDTLDRLDETVVAQNWNSPMQITTPSGEQITPLPVSLPTGGSSYYHLSFPDDSVHTVTVLNGLGYKMKTGPANQDEWLIDAADGDQAYLFDDLSSDSQKGINVIVLIKVAGKDGMPQYLSISSILNEQNTGVCLDSEGKIEDMVVIQSNADWDHPDRILTQTGLPTTVYANNIPCDKISGTSTYTYDSDGVLHQTSATVNYQNNMGTSHVFPDIQFNQVSAQGTWNISGSDSAGDWYTGSGSFSAGAANCTIDIYQGILAGSPSYRGYRGCGDPDEGTQISYIRHWKDQNGVEHQETVTEDAWRFLDIGLAAEFHGSTYPVSSTGVLSASGTHTYDWGDPETWNWNLKQQK